MQTDPRKIILLTTSQIYAQSINPPQIENLFPYLPISIITESSSAISHTKQ
jgi:hypothetical protein